MKVALCFYGLVGSRQHKDGRGESLPPDLAHGYYDKHIFQHNDVDTFIHSWSTEHQDELSRLYRPKKSVIETQRSFTVADCFRSPKGMREHLSAMLNPSQRERRLEAVRRAYSRWYSSKVAINLKREFEQENDFTYDCVMVTRLDVAFFSDLRFAEYELDCFWASHWNEAAKADNDYVSDRSNHLEGRGFLDFWFFSNSANMDRFSTLFDHIESYDPSAHIAARAHVDSFTDKIRYTLFRWEDHEMVRRKFFQSVE